MKNTIKVLGFIALAAVIGFSMIACGGDDGGDSGGAKDMNGKYQSGNDSVEITGDSITIEIGSDTTTGTITDKKTDSYDVGGGVKASGYKFKIKNNSNAEIGNGSYYLMSSKNDKWHEVNIELNDGGIFSGNRDGGNTGANQFIGKWVESGGTVTCTASTWKADYGRDYQGSGPYKLDSPTKASFYATAGGDIWGEAIVSGNTMTVRSTMGMFTLYKQ
jgi:hypothetical protein